MNYVKKMCILRQIKQGFSGDGKTLSGLIKIEQYGKNLAVEVSVINFAPLVSGEYYCLLSDGNGKTEMLTLRGKSLFNLLSDLDISTGFCGIICYVKNEVVPIAYGINGNKAYDWKTILNAALPPVFPRVKGGNIHSEIAGSSNAISQNEAPRYEMKPDPLPPPTPPLPPLPPTPPVPTEEEITPPENAPTPPREVSKKSYDDETVVTENYFERKDDECSLPEKTKNNARAKSTTESENAKAGAIPEENGDAARVRQSFKTDPDGYYFAVKTEIDRLFKDYPRDKTLNGAFSCSEWVRVKGTAKEPQYLVGILKNDGKVLYICYALRAEDRNHPPSEIKNVCTFVPIDVYDDNRGFFVIFQSAATGECIRPMV
ncbi:MAG: hypothetical protein IKA57_05580 [Clostridia bacterium]|nr:hypothetical protein [Clostridia bacterium]